MSSRVLTDSSPPRLLLDRLLWAVLSMLTVTGLSTWKWREQKQAY